MKESQDIELGTIEHTNETAHLPSNEQDRPQVFTKYFYGSNLVFCFHRGEPLMTIGPHWYMFVFLTTFLVAITVLLLIYITPLEHTLTFYLTLIVGSITIIAYTTTALKNPGILTLNRRYKSVSEEDTLDSFCTRCGVQKTSTSQHCYDCNVCIDGYDHHCPWTGKCIGKGNLQPFNVFVAMIFFYLMYAIIITAARDILK